MDHSSTAANAFKQAIEQVKTRRQELLNELSELDDALKRYGVNPGLLGTGKGPGARNGSSSTGAPKEKKRRRRPAPSLEWLEGLLREGKRSQQEIAHAALRADHSGIGAIALLQRNKEHFRSEKGPRVPGQKGLPPVLWSLK